MNKSIEWFARYVCLYPADLRRPWHKNSTSRGIVCRVNRYSKDVRIYSAVGVAIDFFW